MTYEDEYDGWTDEEKADEAADLQARLAVLGPSATPGAPAPTSDLVARLDAATTQAEMEAIVLRHNADLEAEEVEADLRRQQAQAQAVITAAGYNDPGHAIANATSTEEVMVAVRAAGLAAGGDWD